MFAVDVFEPNDVLNLDRSESSAKPISAISFVAGRPVSGTSWTDVLEVAIEAAMSFVASSSWRDRHWWFFGATDMWRERRPLGRQKKFWHAIGVAEALQASPEVAFHSGEKYRRAALAKVSAHVIPFCAERARTSQAGLFILSEAELELSRASVKEWFGSVFRGEKSDVDWNLAIRRLAKSAEVLVRCSGSFDDPDAAVDFFFNPGLTAP
ncbi:MAG: hypothetical protein AAF715_29295 [Myxococcota bacterium]